MSLLLSIEMEQPHISEQSHEMISKLQVNIGNAICDFIINYGIGLIVLGLVPLFINNNLTCVIEIIYNWILAKIHNYYKRHYDNFSNK